MLCDPETSRPIIAIELDDPSHARPNRIERDEMVDNTFKDAGLLPLHTRATYRYDTEWMEGEIRLCKNSVV